jgi:hypothetical protein
VADLFCPNCGSSDWKAIEQFTALTPCRLMKGPEGIEIDYDMRAELAREAATSVTTHYICGTDECGFQVEAHRIGELPDGGQ